MLNRLRHDIGVFYRRIKLRIYNPVETTLTDIMTPIIISCVTRADWH